MMKSRLRSVVKEQDRRTSSWIQALILACVFTVFIMFITMQNIRSSLYQSDLAAQERLFLSEDTVTEELERQARQFQENLNRITMGDGGEIPIRTRGIDESIRPHFPQAAMNSPTGGPAAGEGVVYRSLKDTEVVRTLFTLGLNPKKVQMDARIGAALRMVGVNPIKDGRLLHWKEVLESECTVGAARQLLDCHPTNGCTPSPTVDRLNRTKFLDEGFDGPFPLRWEEGSSARFARMGDDWKVKQASVGAAGTRVGMNPPCDSSCFLWQEDCYDLATDPSILGVVKEVLGEGVMLYSMSIESADAGSIQLMHIDDDPGHCRESATVVIGSPLRLLTSSHAVEYKASMLRTIKLQFLRGRAFLNNQDHGWRTSEQALLNWTLESPETKGRDLHYQNINVDYRSFVVLAGHMWHASVNPDETQRTSIVLQFAKSRCQIREVLGFMGISYQRIPILSPVLPPALFLSKGSDFGSTYMNDVRKWTAFQQEDQMATSALLAQLIPHNSIKDTSWTDSEIAAAGANFVNAITVATAQSGPSLTDLFREKDKETQMLRASTRILAGITAEVFVKTSSLRCQVVSEMHKHREEELLVMLEGQIIVVRTEEGPLSARTRREMILLTSATEVFFPANSPHAIIALTERVTYYILRWFPRRPDGDDAQAAMAAAQGRARARYPQAPFLQEKIMQDKRYLLRPLQGLEGIHSYTIRMLGGQGYDPGNQYGFDLLELGLIGKPEVLPKSSHLVRLSVALIPANTPHLLWNSIRFPASVLILEFHPLSYQTNQTAVDDNVDSATFGFDSKVMRK